MADVYVPESLEDAVGFLAGHADVAAPIAGGTDLLIDTRVGRADPEWLVDLSPLGSLAGIALHGETLRIGALTRVRALELDPGHLRTRRLEALLLARGGSIDEATPALEEWRGAHPHRIAVRHAVGLAGIRGARPSPAGCRARPRKTTRRAGCRARRGAHGR